MCERRAVRTYVGQGQTVSSQELKVIDTGTLTITNKRLMFTGSRENRSTPINKIISTSPWTDAIEILVESRQKAMVFTAYNPVLLYSIIELAASLR